MYTNIKCLFINQLRVTSLKMVYLKVVCLNGSYSSVWQVILFSNNCFKYKIVLINNSKSLNNNNVC